MPRPLPLVIAAAAAAVPVSFAIAGALHVATPTPTPPATSTARARPTPTRTAVPKKAAVHPGVVTRTIMGPSVDMDWGPVQVTIIVKGSRLVDVKATAPMERARSNFINSQAIPWLRQEVLQAQSANVNLIGGATLTSEAYAQSLQAALDQAHLSPAHS